MAQKELQTRQRQKHDTAANWTANDPILLDGEIIVVETSNGETRFKVGDGSKKFSQLPYSDEAVRNLISGKVDKVSGKGLSTNDYTTGEKTKLEGIAENANNYTHPTSAGNKHIPAGGSSGQILRWSADGTATWGADNNTTYAAFKGATADASGGTGLVPAPAAGAQTKYLRADGTWQTPPDTNTTYGAMTGATASAAGKAGLVPAPAAGTQTKYLRGDGTWATPPDTNTTYSNMGAATASAAGKAGLVPAPAAGKQTSFLRGDGTWVVPTNTTYSAATQSATGLMSADDKKKLDGVAAGANAYSHPTTAGNKHIPAGGSSGQILRWSADGTAVWGADNNTTYSAMTGATTSAAGKAGLVPAPAAGAATRYLRSDGTWQTPPDTNTTYSALKNPYALTVQFNGTTNKTYDGSSAQTLNITPSAIGAATSGHTHSLTNGLTGTLPVSKGGTGGTNQATAQRNLGIDCAAGADHYIATFDGVNTQFSSYTCNCYSVTIDNGKIATSLSGVEPTNLALTILFGDPGEDNINNYTALRVNGSEYYLIGGMSPSGSLTLFALHNRFTLHPTRLEFKSISSYDASSVWHGLWSVPGAYSRYAYGGSAFAYAVSIAKGGTGATTAASALTNLGGVAKTGDTMTGNQNISTSLYPSVKLTPTYNDTTNQTVFEGSYVGASSFAAWEDSTGNNRRMLEVRTKTYKDNLHDAVVLRTSEDGTWATYNMYHTGNLFYATSLPSTGVHGQICLVPV